MNTIIIQTILTDDSIVKQATITCGNYVEEPIWFKFPKSEAKNLTERADPFIYALVFHMMRSGGDFQIIGADVSKSVIDNITMFCRIWHTWFPNIYKTINFIANEIPDDFRPNNNKMITAFSGGLDAAYTTYKYKKDLDPRYHYNVVKSVMIHGADIPLNNTDQFNVAFHNAKKMTDDLCIPLIPVKTNYREHSHNWEHEFGTVVVATLNFFSKHIFNAAASDNSVNNPILPWGLNPITDRYLCNDTFRFIADGYEHSRTERAAFIKNWCTGLENLRVCWRNSDKSKNCGICEKCIRTKLNLLAVGVSHTPSMPSDITLDELADKNLSIPQKYICHIQEIYTYAKQNGTLNDEWLNTLDTQIAIWAAQNRRHHSLWWHIRHMKF